MSILLNIPIEIIQYNINSFLKENELFNFYSTNKYLRELFFEINTTLTINKLCCNSFLSKFKNLRKLNISKTEITNFNINFSKIKILNLNYCNKFNDFTFLKYCTELEELYLGLTNISDLNILQNLSKLRNLSLIGCKNLQNINVVKNLKSLQYLSLNNSNISEINELTISLPEVMIL